MNEILKTVLSLSLSGSLLILLLLLCKPLIRSRFSKCWQYYIWLVVIARLLLPITPEASPISTMFQEIDGAIVQTYTTTHGQYIVPTPRPQNDIITTGDTPPQSEAPFTDTTRPQNFITVLIQNLWLIWFVVALILLIRKVTIYQGFVKYIKAGRAEVSDTALLDQLALIGEQIEVKKPVELYTNNLISTPLLLGFFRPCIVLPTTNLSDIDFRYTILHELTHYKRKDMFYKWLVQFAICLHWFNPFVYVMGREVGRTCELSCDETVIKALNLQERRAYGDTLLNALGMGGNYKDSLASVTLNESKELLKERLDAIMYFKKKSKIVALGALAITIVVMIGALLIGAYAGNKSSANDKDLLLPIDNTVFLNSDYEKIIALRFKDYEQMTISQYQNKVWEIADTEEYRNLIEQMSFDSQLLEMQNTNKTASFFFHTLLPLISEDWEQNQFQYGIMAPQSMNEDPVNSPAQLDITFSYTILNPKSMTVGEYETIRNNIQQDLQKFLWGRSNDELQDKGQMEQAIQDEVERFIQEVNTADFKVNDYTFIFIELLSDSDNPDNIVGVPWEVQGTEADYQSLLQLRTANYDSETVEKFDLSLLNWANENYDIYSRIIENDLLQNNLPSFLTDEEKSFISVTLRASNAENSMSVQNHYSKEDVPVPGLTFEMKKGSETDKYAYLMYGYSYKMEASTLTVRERDLALAGVSNDIQEYWEEKSLDELYTIDSDELYNHLEAILKKHSTDSMIISLEKNLFIFDTSTMFQ